MIKICVYIYISMRRYDFFSQAAALLMVIYTAK